MQIPEFYAGTKKEERINKTSYRETPKGSMKMWTDRMKSPRGPIRLVKDGRDR
jgi:hypothetical protein